MGELVFGLVLLGVAFFLRLGAATAEQQRLLNTTLTPEALTRQYLDVLRDMKTGNNLVILVPTQGGIPILNIGDLRRNLRQQ